MRIGMAAESKSPTEVKAHEKSYSLFISMLKWGAIVTAVVTLLVVLLIAN